MIHLNLVLATPLHKRGALAQALKYKMDMFLPQAGTPCFTSGAISAIALGLEGNSSIAAAEQPG